jgi:hypothetical protein
MAKRRMRKEVSRKVRRSVAIPAQPIATSQSEESKHKTLEFASVLIYTFDVVD